MTKKKMMKVMMAHGISRNEARVYADACGSDMPHIIMLFAVLFLTRDAGNRQA